MAVEELAEVFLADLPTFFAQQHWETGNLDCR